MRSCGHCRKLVAPDEAFCTHCGQQVSSPYAADNPASTGARGSSNRVTPRESSPANAEFGSSASRAWFLGGGAAAVLLMIFFFRMSYADAVFVQLTGAQLAQEVAAVLWGIPLLALGALLSTAVGGLSPQGSLSTSRFCAGGMILSGALIVLILLVSYLKVAEYREYVAGGFWLSVLTAVCLTLTGYFQYRNSRKG